MRVQLLLAPRRTSHTSSSSPSFFFSNFFEWSLPAISSGEEGEGGWGCMSLDEGGGNSSSQHSASDSSGGRQRGFGEGCLVGEDGAAAGWHEERADAEDSRHSVSLQPPPTPSSSHTLLSVTNDRLDLGERLRPADPPPPKHNAHS